MRAGRAGMPLGIDPRIGAAGPQEERKTARRRRSDRSVPSPHRPARSPRRVPPSPTARAGGGWWLPLLLVAPAFGACRQPAAPPPDADAAPPAPAFVAAAFRTLEIPELELRLEAPENLAPVVEGDTLRLTADGFPGVSIRAVRTGTTAGSGGGGRCDERRCRYEYDAPCRRLTCEALEPGENVSFLPALCGSLRSTYQPPRSPVVRPLSTGGNHSNCDDRQIELTLALDGPIAQLLPQFDACWREHAADDPAWTTGEVNVRLERKIGEGTERSYRLSADLSGLEGETTDLQRCLDAAVQPLRGRLPAIVDADCSFALDHRFLLDRAPTCPATGEAAAAEPDGGGAGSGPGRDAAPVDDTAARAEAGPEGDTR